MGPNAWTAWPLNIGPIGCPETSLTNDQSTLRNIPEESDDLGFPVVKLTVDEPLNSFSQFNATRIILPYLQVQHSAYPAHIFTSQVRIHFNIIC
jgi:hypothetical protein